MRSGIAKSWATNNKVTIYLLDQIPDEVWPERIPGYRQKTIRMVGAHLHNCRGMWVTMVGKRFGIVPPPKVDRHRVSRIDLSDALVESGDAIGAVLDLAWRNSGYLPGFAPPNVEHFAAYIIAHEGHHRGQITMALRQLGHPLSDEVMAGMWQWGKRVRD